MLTTNDTDSQVFVKTRLPIKDQKNTVYPEGFKLSLSKEITLSSDHPQSRPIIKLFEAASPKSLISREKQRISFVQSIVDGDNNYLPCLRFDFTTVKTIASGNDLEKTYEIELEYIGNNVGNAEAEVLQQMTFDAAKLLWDSIRRLICLIQGNPTPINIKQHNQIVRSYMSVLGKEKKKKM